MNGLAVLAGWIIGLATGKYIEEQKHREREVRREFVNADLAAGTCEKEVGYYLKGKRLG